MTMTPTGIREILDAFEKGKHLQVYCDGEFYDASRDTLSDILRNIAEGHVYRVQPEPQEVWILRSRLTGKLSHPGYYTVQPTMVPLDLIAVRFREVTDQPWPAGNDSPEYDAMQPLLNPRRTP
jgi:hypothetical protein